VIIPDPGSVSRQALSRGVGATGGSSNEGEGPARRTRIPAPTPDVDSRFAGMPEMPPVTVSRFSVSDGQMDIIFANYSNGLTPV
jgi:hypothetical protein